MTLKGVEQAHATEVMEPAMQAAIDDVTKDMAKYVKRKMQERLGIVKRGRKAGRN
jgi:hypothetical protein